MGAPVSKSSNSTEFAMMNGAKNSSKKTARENLTHKYTVVWLDSDFNENDIMYQNTITRLQSISISMNTFKAVNDCLMFLNTSKDWKILMIISEKLIDQIWPRIKSLSQVHSIYILCSDQIYKEYPKEYYEKVRGNFDKVDPIYEILKRETRPFHQELLLMSIIPTSNYSKDDLKQLNQSFLYWFSVKQIILDTKYDKQDYKQIAEFCRKQYHDNPFELKIIDEFERSYFEHTPIWWYTRRCFLYVIVNRALQTQDFEVVVKMGSFIQDLYQQLNKLQRDNENLFVLYRCQNASFENLEQMKTLRGNLLSFNNFLIVNLDYETSLEEVRRARNDPNSVGILFRIESALDYVTPFASLKKISYSNEFDQNVLFAMHSIYRIGESKQIEDRVWQIKLILTDPFDRHIVRLNELIQQETRDAIGWYKLSKLMIAIRDFDHAKEVCFVLLSLLSENDLLSISNIYNELGLICDEMGDYKLSLEYYQKAIELRQKCLPPNHRSLGVAYNNIGEVQRELGEYYSALSSHKKSLSIKQKSLTPNHLSLATTNNNLGLVNESLGEFAQALDYYKKAFEIKRKVLPPNHPDLAVTYNNMGELHREMGNYPAALNYFEKVLQIRLKTSNADDSSLAITYNNIGLTHREMGNYSQAISYFEKSLDIKHLTFASDHPSLAITYNNMGDIHQQMENFSEALANYETALEIQQKAFTINHSELATTYNNIGVTYQSMGDYPKALSFYEKSLTIRQKALPANHPSIGMSFDHLGHLYQLMGDNTTALDYYQKTQKLQEKSLGANHPSLAATYNNLADIQRKLGNPQLALQLYKKSLEIMKKPQLSNHPILITTYNNIGAIHQDMQEYSAALQAYKRSLEIQQRSLPSNHPNLARSYYNVAVTYQSLKEYSSALDNYVKTLKIQEKILPKTHPDLAKTYHSMATAFVARGNLKKGIEYEQKAVDIASSTLPSDHPDLQTYQDFLKQIQIQINSDNNINNKQE